MTTLREAAQQALEALDAGVSVSPKSVLHDRLRAALAQQAVDPVDEYRKGFIDGQIDMRDRSEEQEPVAWVDLLKDAEQIVRSKPLWKKFIDGTPLANDIAVWMADFAQKHTHPPRREWQSLTADAVFANDKIMAVNASLGLKMNQLMDLVCAIEAALKEKNQ